MRYVMSVIECDADGCGRWEADGYEGMVSHVGGTRITASERAPGWSSTDDKDFCPEHSVLAGEEGRTDE